VVEVEREEEDEEINSRSSEEPLSFSSCAACMSNSLSSLDQPIPSTSPGPRGQHVIYGRIASLRRVVLTMWRQPPLPHRPLVALHFGCLSHFVRVESSGCTRHVHWHSPTPPAGGGLQHPSTARSLVCPTLAGGLTATSSSAVGSCVGPFSVHVLRYLLPNSSTSHLPLSSSRYARPFCRKLLITQLPRLAKSSPPSLTDRLTRL
jgi:hypothetical protein